MSYVTKVRERLRNYRGRRHQQRVQDGLFCRLQWGKRELERQIDSCQFVRAALSNQKLSTVLRELHPFRSGKGEIPPAYST